MQSLRAVLVHGDRQNDPDDQIVDAARMDPAAFAVLYRRYRDQVYAYLRARTRTVDDAADLTQQVFLRALDALPRYRGGQDAFVAWLFRIARNAAINLQGRGHPTLSWESVPEALHPLADGDVAAGLLRQEDLARLHLLVAALPPDTQDLLALRFSAQLSTPAIAAVIGKSEAATRKRVSRAIRSLQEHYHDASG